MELVVDTNILFSLFRDSESFKRFIKENDLDLCSPYKALSELKKYSERICKISGLNKEEFNSIMEELPKIVKFRKVFKKQVEAVLSTISHPSDAPFLALAAELDIPVWSEDKHFKEQSLVKSYTFRELKELLSKLSST